MTDHLPDQVVTYAAPEGNEPSDLYTMQVGGKDVFVHPARVSAMPVNQVWPGYQRPMDQTEMAAFAYVDLQGPAEVVLQSSRDVEEVTVRPLSLGIVPDVQGNTIRFSLPGPSHVVVEVNGWHHAFHLFASSIEDDPPDPTDPNLHYFGPGIHHAGEIMLRSGETVYIHGGAIVYGAIHAENAHHIKILGRGILDSSDVKRFDMGPTVFLNRCQDAEVRGIVLRDPHVWTVVPAMCERVTISDLKLIGLWRYNADGIDIVNCRDVVIEDCFVRSFDDSIVLKGFNRYRDTPSDDLPVVENVIVRRCTIWNDWGRALEIGAETQADHIRHVSFEDCDIVHHVHIAMDIQNGDRAEVSDMVFRDIRVEDAIVEHARIAETEIPPSELGRLIEMIIRETPYSKDSERGRIHDIRLEDITVVGKPFPESRFIGHDEQHMVEDVTITNLRIQGEPMETPGQAAFAMNPYTRNIRLLAPES
jgi:hypothetical protein